MRFSDGRGYFGLISVVLLLMLAFPGAASLVASDPAQSGRSASHYWVDGFAPGTLAHHLPAASQVARPPSLLPGSSSSVNSPDCSTRARAWNLTHADTRPPPMVLQSLQGACPVGHDEPSISFVSNASFSGSKVQFVLDLPSNRTNVASAFSTFWVGMWLAGVPCSYRDQSYLQVQLNPPFSSLGLNPSRNWTVQAPVWDLVPAGSCDPRCQNTTTTTTIDGVGYCEEDAAISGVGTYTSTGWGNFSPGDRLRVQMVGLAGAFGGLSVRIDDLTASSSSLSWTYSASVSVSGQPLNPFYNASGWIDGGWGYGLNVQAGWVGCPTIPGPTACNSYDQPAITSVELPRIISATFGNGSSSAFTNPFLWTATASSSGACSGILASVAPCSDFRGWGGTGAYPYWSVVGAAGNSTWSLGRGVPLTIGNYGGPTGQFSSLGAPPTYLDPAVMGPTSMSLSGFNAGVSAAFADPYGITQVLGGDYWCNGTGVPTVTLLNGTLGPGPLNTSFSGNWSIGFNRNGLWKGTANWWIQDLSAAGVLGPRTYGSAPFIGGAGSNCVFPSPPTPWFGAANITPVSGGYLLRWTENSTAIQNYTVWLNATQNGTPFGVRVGPTPVATVLVPNASLTYRVALTAFDYHGTNSSRSGWFAPPPVLAPLSAHLAGPNSTTLWLGRTGSTFFGNITGGAGPFTLEFAFSDGTNTTFTSANRSVVVLHDFGNYFGNALVEYRAIDAFGSVASSNSILVRIWATPLGVPQNISGADGFVNVSWSSPMSPAAPVRQYTVFYGTNSTTAGALTQLWPNNATSPNGSHEWNTTRNSLLIPVPDGTTLFAEVIAWNMYGAGQLPASALVGSVAPVLTATAARLAISPIFTLPGGPAPFNDALSAFVTGGTNFAVATAVYSFPGGPSVTPSVQMVPGGAWVNASYTFLTPGTKTIVLHVSDVLFDTVIAITSVFVTAGVGPSATVSTVTPSSWVGTPVTFTTAVISGSGNYSYAWSFGDGTSANGSPVAHAFASAGNYLVLVSVTDENTGGVTQRNLTEVVFALPAVSISTSAGPNGSASYAFQAVTAGGSGPLSVVWAFGDGTVGHGKTVQHDFGSSGPYTVSVIATDPASRAAYANVTLNVLTGGGGSSGASTLSPGVLALLIVIATLAVLFLVGMVYFWARSREPAEPPPETTPTTAIEPVEESTRSPPGP